MRIFSLFSRRLRPLAGPALVCVLWFACAPVALASFTIKDEQELGRKFDVLIRSSMPLVQDPEVVSYVRDLAERLLAIVPPQPFTFTTDVILSNSLNAFATPGGYLFVHTGLILGMDHESQVAGVIAHEIAHVTQRHIASRIERAQTVTILSLLGALAGAFLGGEGGAAAMTGSLAAGQAAMLNYSRADEANADQMGMLYLVKAGFPPRGLAESFKKIRQQQWMTGGGNIPTYLSTHPDVTGRISEISARVEKLPPEIRDRPENDARFLRVQTIIRARYSDPATARRYFEQAPADDCLALMGLGIVQERTNQAAQAAETFERALVCAPKDELIWREAGRFHVSRGDPKKAEQYLDKALAMDPRDYMGLFFKARLLSTTGRQAESFPAFREVLRYAPEDSEVHYYYGRALGEGGKTFDAYLHLAYSALYSNDKKKVASYRDRAAERAVSQEEKDALDLFDARYEERREFWD